MSEQIGNGKGQKESIGITRQLAPIQLVIGIALAIQNIVRFITSKKIVEPTPRKNKMSTNIYRKCKSCGYYQGGGFFTNGWCHWLGKQRNPNSYECEDGFKEKDNQNVLQNKSKCITK